ncbi:hypothetical protein HZI73_07235 [Vallitalea pronyensis]|uniref:NADH:flavin oxidoreductase/NADH oxidase N-terminal domain-containing protein n=1 Tax=Vallitalea pronyensis TaxID=1348613 RepID=A0A8J8MI87_9FIRM|nr:hypothetical protein [Vallitalea pronyensis]QUI22104.1 hypothetical protein HZI73_07235 [Vallitalea pronyensis]
MESLQACEDMKLFSPVKIGKQVLKNRIVMAPMVTYHLDHKQSNKDKIMQYYQERLENPIGMLVSQSIFVPKLGVAMEKFEDTYHWFVEALNENCKKHGTKCVIQLSYDSPSYYEDGFVDVTNYSQEELLELKNKYIDCIKLLLTWDVDGIELHGAHGYFMNMMNAIETNKRKDQFGLGKMSYTFLKEIIESVRPFLGDKMLTYRLGLSNDEVENIKMSQFLQEMKIDSIHYSYGIPKPKHIELNAFAEYFDVVKMSIRTSEHIKVPTIFSNEIRTLNRAENLLKHTKAELIAFGRPFLADANFINHALTDLNYKPCISCKKCRWFYEPDNCVQKK